MKESISNNNTDRKVSVSVIVPSNNKNMILEFLDSYTKNLSQFKNISQVIVIGNGELKDLPKKYINKNYIKFIRYDKKFDIVPFVELRGKGMELFPSDFFLFLDDDHRFSKESDKVLVDSNKFMATHEECGIIQLEKHESTKFGFYIKKYAHIWTSRGLFIRNIGFDYKTLYELKGACEDLLFGYEIINQCYIPYCYYNSGITRGNDRDKSTPNNYKQYNDKSYNEKILDKNVIGYIRNKYCDNKWIFYGNLRKLQYPSSLRSLIKSRLGNEII